LLWEDQSAAGLSKWLRTPTSASTVEHDALVQEIVGDLSSLQKASEPEPVRNPRAFDNLLKLAGRLGKTWNNEKHREKINGMLKPLLSALHFRSSPANDEARDRVVSSMLNLLGSEVHAAAANE
jgi:hypothetical protein